MSDQDKKHCAQCSKEIGFFSRFLFEDSYYCWDCYKPLDEANKKKIAQESGDPRLLCAECGETLNFFNRIELGGTYFCWECKNKVLEAEERNLNRHYIEASDVVLTTTASLPGLHIENYLGVVNAIAINNISDDQRLREVESGFVIENACNKLKAKAFKMGANAVLGLTVQFSLNTWLDDDSITSRDSHGEKRATACVYGTAALARALDLKADLANFITFTCTECGFTKEIPASYAGKTGDCPRCGLTHIISSI